MAEAIRVGIIGAGWPGAAHARGYKEAGGFRVVAVADLIPQRRQAIAAEFGSGVRQYADASELLADIQIDAVSICLPNHLHAPNVIAALRAGKHVVCETPPTISLKQALKIDAAATRSGKTVLYAMQRRFGAAEQAARQAIDKGYAGELFHARASWMRTRGIPLGTGWYAVKSQSGGGALIDIGIHMLDLSWNLLGQPRPISVYGTMHQKFKDQAPAGLAMDVEDSAFALIRFEGGKSLELSASWCFNQPPHQQGAVCRLYGNKAAVDVYTPNGATIYRNFDAKGQPKPTSLKPPRVAGHVTLMRHFKDCTHGKATPLAGPAQGIVLMQMVEAIYKSAQSGKSVEIKS